MPILPPQISHQLLLKHCCITLKVTSKVPAPAVAVLCRQVCFPREIYSTWVQHPDCLKHCFGDCGCCLAFMQCDPVLCELSAVRSVCWPQARRPPTMSPPPQNHMAPTHPSVPAPQTSRPLPSPAVPSRAARSAPQSYPPRSHSTLAGAWSSQHEARAVFVTCCQAVSRVGQTSLGQVHLTCGHILHFDSTYQHQYQCELACKSRANSAAEASCGAGLQDHAVRAINFAALTSGNLGRLQADASQEPASSQASPPHSPVRMARHALALLDEV